MGGGGGGGGGCGVFAVVHEWCGLQPILEVSEERGRERGQVRKGLEREE